MIRFLNSHELSKNPLLVDGMFCDRRIQFSERLGWDVHVDDKGWERDQYDDLDPVYLIYEGKGGRHYGSVRMLPTTGRTMLNEHFTHLTDGVEIQSPLIWESTRYCLSPEITRNPRLAMHVSSSLLLAGLDMGLRLGLNFYVAVFDEPMLRVYRAVNYEPDVMGTGGVAPRRVCAGIWPVTEELRNAVAANVAGEELIAAAADEIRFGAVAA